MLALGLSLGLPFGGVPRIAGFNPLTIEYLSEWFDYRTLTSVGDGNPVTDWAGNKGLYTTSETGTARPTYAADDGDGRASVQLDGVDDKLSGAITNSDLFGATGDFEFWMVVRLPSAGGVFSCTGVTNQNGLNISSAAGGTLSMAHGSVNVGFSADFQDNAWHVIRCVKIGARRIMQRDGVTIYDATTSAGPYGTGADSLNLGNYFGTYMTGAYRHWLAFTAPLDDATAAALTSYLLTA